MEIVFQEAEHRYFVDGRELPSVTQCLALAQDWSRVNMEILERARTFGDHVHRACSYFLLHTLNWASLDAYLRPYVDALSSFLAHSRFQVLHSELRVAHLRWGYAGTLDLIGLLNDRLSVIDIKSGQIPHTVGAQTAAYAEAYLHMHGSRTRIQRYALQLDPTLPVGYRLHALKEPIDLSNFLACLRVLRFRRESHACA